MGVLHRLCIVVTVLAAGLAAKAPVADIIDIAASDADRGQFSTLIAALKAADLLDTFSGKGPFTLFAPTNAAFDKLPAGTVEDLLKPENKAKLTAILTYHVLGTKVLSKDLYDGEKAKTLNGKEVTVTIHHHHWRPSVVKINDAMVTKVDVERRNGVFHVIDSVLLPPASPEKNKTIVDIAASDPEFSTLVAALKAADLVDTLSGKGLFTVFAPTNAAFAKLPAGTLEDLLKPENKAKLTAILTYHVLGTEVLSKDLSDGEKAKTLNGKDVTVTIHHHHRHWWRPPVVKINDAIVTKVDVEGTNGVIHIIDSVLLPPASPEKSKTIEFGTLLV